MINFLIYSMSLPGLHKRCTLQQVLNAQDWSELLGHVQNMVVMEMHYQQRELLA